MGAVAVVNMVTYQRNTPWHRSYRWPQLYVFYSNFQSHILHINGGSGWTIHPFMATKKRLWNCSPFNASSLGFHTCVT